ncbi:Cloroperoxidase [Sistotremastrum suecicum HHB10207 ss-3]|uniref:Cloroperoxidase n=1 Tax=Sistotremastrum suecicum HHB10207 ss-3 TaxID=1314776 RepID=A0A166FUF0_9AGAM|nr:Cloroperoxidase [Sistotremastrum suecicum HHB10207 ss-3]
MYTVIQNVFLCASSFISSSVLCPLNVDPTFDIIPSSLFAGHKIVLPRLPVDTGLKKIPDAAHPFKAPGPTDQRGPCPALNTLANHGYIPRTGIASFEQILNGTGEGFNMARDLAGFLAGFAMLARGNAFEDLLSIGGEDHRVPPLPGQIDGPGRPGGIAKHGRFEGDVSMTRQDAALGDDRHFQDSLFDQFLAYIGHFGDNSPVTGNYSLVNLKVMQEFKWERFLDDQSRDPKLSFHAGRIGSSYNEAAFILKFFANGTDETLSIPSLGSIFRNQTFAPNWWRRASPGDVALILATASDVLSAHPVQPGQNAPNLTYITDPPYVGPCNAAYFYLAVLNLPYTYTTLINHSTGLFAENVKTLLGVVAGAFNCTVIPPAGPVGT